VGPHVVSAIVSVVIGVVLASNLLLENVVEPKVMGRTLDIHPLVVLVVSALGGLLAASSVSSWPCPPP
jgi:predicted PurR-regulated permease PerM